MKEIAKNIAIETGYPGVTLGVIQWSHGLILIDAPFHPDDVRSWRSSLLSISGGANRMLINLDAHLDRTLGGTAMECTIIAHQRALDVFRNRPITFKPQSIESGSEWELKDGVISTRWAPPEITFTEEMQIHWDGSQILLQHRPGPMGSAIWVVLPEQKIVFVGDAVIPDKPPFLTSADIPVWIENIKELLRPAFKEFLVVSGRNGLVPYEKIRHQIRFLEKTQRNLERLASKGSTPQDTARLVPKLIKDFEFPAKYQAFYEKRLASGLFYYYVHHYSDSKSELEGKYWE